VIRLEILTLKEVTMQEKRLLEIISNETKSEVCNLEIVTPEIFSSVFIEKAQEHDLKDFEEFSKKYTDSKVHSLLQIQDETTKKANALSQTTEKALEAIQGQDEGSLKEVFTETQNLRKEIEKLKESLYKDELTSVYNRKWLYDTLLEEEKSTFKQNGTLVIVDLNYFKIVNDTYGHIIGDKVLVFVASQLRKSRGYVVRYGGDEFLVIFDAKTDVAKAKKIMHNIREDMLKKHLKARDAHFRVSFSYGVAVFKQNDSFEEIVKIADDAMYDDKVKIKERIKGIDV
jgi:diguanylate cyclase (GGDEF)-like protein